MVAICETCGVEHAHADGVCEICADERQWVPADGQRWTTLAALAASGREVHVREAEPDLFAVTVEPKVGIGQTAYVVRTPDGNVLWDPVGFLDDPAVQRLRELGRFVAITSSHPHMYGVQVEWSRALGAAPVLINEHDRDWVRRPDPVIETWGDARELAPGLKLVRLGGHFPGSAVLHWAAGADGRGVLLTSDTIQANPDLASVTFMRSYPNRIPLSPAVVERLARAAGALAFDRLYDNFARAIATDAAEVVRRSAARYAGWVRGEFDART
jgi:glyoxylase-like metal-dependent hydrolase (beta-lactamase superfamily II)